MSRTPCSLAHAAIASSLPSIRRSASTSSASSDARESGPGWRHCCTSRGRASSGSDCVHSTTSIVPSCCVSIASKRACAAASPPSPAAAAAAAEEPTAVVPAAAATVPAGGCGGRKAARQPRTNSSRESAPSPSASSERKKRCSSSSALEARASSWGSPRAVTLTAAKPSGAASRTAATQLRNMRMLASHCASLWYSKILAGWLVGAGTLIASAAAVAGPALVRSASAA